jgi:hypothetical protein
MRESFRDKTDHERPLQARMTPGGVSLESNAGTTSGLSGLKEAGNNEVWTL